MFLLVIGGSASGKSDYAERRTLLWEGPKIYLATMQPFGREAEIRIARHQKLRKGRGFDTVECCRGVHRVLIPAGGNVLLEDLGNLVANELYGFSGPDGPSAGSGWTGTNGIASGKDEAEISRAIADEIRILLEKCRNLAVVTNDVFESGHRYEGDTLRYLKVLAQVNRELARMADEVVEVVCGLPCSLK